MRATTGAMVGQTPGRGIQDRVDQHRASVMARNRGAEPQPVSPPVGARADALGRRCTRLGHIDGQQQGRYEGDSSPAR